VPIIFGNRELIESGESGKVKNGELQSKVNSLASVCRNESKVIEWWSPLLTKAEEPRNANALAVKISFNFLGLMMDIQSGCSE